jgi:hypothetical protein
MLAPAGTQTRPLRNLSEKAVSKVSGNLTRQFCPGSTGVSFGLPKTLLLRRIAWRVLFWVNEWGWQMKAVFCFNLAHLLLLGFSIGTATGTEPGKNAVRESALGEQLVVFFEEGFKRGPRVAAEAQQRYKSISADSSNDPRIDYAFGLVQLRQLKNKEAQASFKIATNRPGKPYWPAWQALIWTHGAAKETVFAYDRLTEMAKRLVETDNAPEDANVVEQVGWIGKSMAAFDKLADTPKSREAWSRQDEVLRELLGEKLLTAYDAGRDEIHVRHALVEDEIRSTRDKTLEKNEQKRVEKQSKTEKDLESTKEKRDELKKTAEDFKKSLDEQLQNLDKQLSLLEKDHALLEKRGQSIVNSQNQLSLEMTQLQQESMSGAGKKNQGFNYEAAIDQRRLKQTQLQVEYDKTLIAAQQVTQKAQGLVQQRTGLVQQFQKATGQLVKQDATLDKWQGRLKKNTEKLKAPADDKGPAVMAKIKQAQSFRTYIELDVVKQSEHLLESYGIVMLDKPEEPATKQP